MHIQGQDAEGRVVEAEVKEISADFIASINSGELSQRDLARWIDRLPVSADVKVLIDKISKATLTVGQAVIRLGRVVLSWVVDFIRTAPMVSFGLLLGAVFGALFAAIPVIGALLSPVVLPLSLALGFALTVSHELSDPNLRGRVEELVSRFAPLAAKA